MSIELALAQRDLESNGTIAVSVNHTVLVADRNIDVTTGATDKIVTLPLLSASLGREITLSKADAGAGNVVADGNGSETINGSLTNNITSRYESKTYVGFPSEWRIK